MTKFALKTVQRSFEQRRVKRGNGKIALQGLPKISRQFVPVFEGCPASCYKAMVELRKKARLGKLLTPLHATINLQGSERLSA